MTSKISFFKIAKEDLRRRIWMVALSCLGNFLALPVAFLLLNRDYLDRISRNMSETSDAQRIYGYYMDFFRTYAIVTVGIVLVLGALITAIWGFRYLYSRKMVDLYHSVPVKRGRFFFVVYLNGLLIWLIPLLAATTVTVILIFANMASLGALSYFGSVLGMILRMICVALICYLTLYHFLLVCIMLSGNVVNALFTSAVLGVSAVTFYGMVQLLCSAFFDTFVELPVSYNHVMWASPLITPIILMSEFAADASGALLIAGIDNTADFSLFLRLANAAVLIFNLWMAYRLYKKRPSELAEHGVDHRHAQTLIRSCASILAGLFGSMVFLWMLDKDAIGWQIFGILLCGIFAFGVSDIILHMNFKSFFAHKLQMGITVLAGCLIFFLFAYDLTGFDSRLPSRNSIKSSALNISNFSDRSNRHQFRKDGVMYSPYDYYEPHVYEDTDTLYALMERLTDEEHLNATRFVGSVQIELSTTLGPFRRTYRLLESDIDVLRPVVENEEYLTTFYPASCGLFPVPVTMQAYSEISHTDCLISEEERMREIMDAYAADFIDNATLEKLHNGIITASLNLNYPYVRSYSQSIGSYSLTLDIYSHYTRTLEKLKQYYPELILDKEDLDIVSLEIFTDSAPADIFLLSPDYASPADTSSDQVYYIKAEGEVYTEEKSDIAILSSFVITEEEELNALMPYLHPGNRSYGPFSEFTEYQNLGQLILSNGYSVSCNVKKSDLPLKAPASVIQKLEETLK